MTENEKYYFVTDNVQTAKNIDLSGFSSLSVSNKEDPVIALDLMLKELALNTDPSGLVFLMCCKDRRTNDELTDHLEHKGYYCRDGRILFDILLSGSAGAGDKLKESIPRYLSSMAGRSLQNPLSLDLLDQDLNSIPYDQFFSAFGYADQDDLYLRSFKDKGDKDKGLNDKKKKSLFDFSIPDLKKLNSQDRGIFFVVNGDSQKDKGVRHARAHFIDFDDFPFPEQIRRLNHFPLEPSIIIKTRKSLHCYWLIQDGDIKQFRNIQKRLIQYFESDPIIFNESRVMRIYGFEHRKFDPVMVTLIKFDPELMYTQRQLAECLPILRKQTKVKPAQKQEQGLVKHGERNGFLVKQAGLYVRKLGDSVSDDHIFELVETDFQKYCEHIASDDLEKRRKELMPAIRRFREHDQAEKEDPDFWKYAMKAWKYENPGKDFDSNTTPWDEVREAGIRAREAGKSFDPVQPRRKNQGYPHISNETRPGLYNFDNLSKSINDGFPVYFVPSEQDCKTLDSFHYVATTTDKWQRKYARHFIGAIVNIIPKNDDSSVKQAEQIKRDLKKYAFTVRIVPGLSRLQEGSVTDYFEKEGGKLQSFKELVKETPGELAPWAYLNGRDEVNVKPSQLAASFSRVMDYIIVRNPLDDNDLFYGFENGVYRRKNKAQIKSMLRKFVPIAYQKDSQIAEAQRTLLELGTKIHSFDELDRNERYINFKNGLFDVKEWRLVPHNPKLLSTVQLQIDYDPSQDDRPVFDRFMNDLFMREDGTTDQESMKALQEFCGLAISNIYVYRCKKALFLCSIRGNTGKSVLMNLIQVILGEENVTSVPIQHMNESTGRFTMGTALGKRLIINGDQTESDVADSSYFKQLTGGDRTKMEMKNQKPLMVRFRGGIMVGCNGLPSFKDDKGEHVFERLLLLMCTNVIPEEKRDATLLDKMRPEIPAITNWLLEGLQRLIQNSYKFSYSKATETALKEYRSRLDTVYRFIKEGFIISPDVFNYDGDNWHYVITGDKNDQVSKRDFYEDYEAWCEHKDIDVVPVKRKNIGQRLESLGLEIDPRGIVGKRKGIYTIRGLKKVNTITGNGRFPTLQEVNQYQEKGGPESPPESPPEWENTVGIDIPFH